MMGDESKKLAIHSIEFSCSSPKQFLMYFAIAVAVAKRSKMADIVAIAPSFGNGRSEVARSAESNFFLTQHTRAVVLLD